MVFGWPSLIIVSDKSANLLILLLLLKIEISTFEIFTETVPHFYQISNFSDFFAIVQIEPKIHLKIYFSETYWPN